MKWWRFMFLKQVIYILRAWRNETRWTDSNKQIRQQQQRRSEKEKKRKSTCGSMRKIKHNWLLTPTIKAIKRWKPTKGRREIKSFPSPSSPFTPPWRLTARRPDHRPPASVSKRQTLPQGAALCGRLIFAAHFNRNPANKERTNEWWCSECGKIPLADGFLGDWGASDWPLPPSPILSPFGRRLAHFRNFSSELEPLHTYLLEPQKKERPRQATWNCFGLLTSRGWLDPRVETLKAAKVVSNTTDYTYSPDWLSDII